METNEMKCEKCGDTMKKIDDHTMKCEGCGTIKEIVKGEKEEKSEEPTENTSAHTK